MYFVLKVPSLKTNSLQFALENPLGMTCFQVRTVSFREGIHLPILDVYISKVHPQKIGVSKDL